MGLTPQHDLSSAVVVDESYWMLGNEEKRERVCGGWRAQWS